MNDPNLARFRDFLIVEFNEEQLAGLCQDIGLNYADLPGTGAYGKSRELIEIARSRHILGSLMNRAKELRADAYKNANIKDIEPDGPVETPLAAAQSGPVTANVPGSANPEPLPAASSASTREDRAALIAALTPRARLLAVLVAALLVIVAVLTIALPKPGASGNNATAADATTTAIAATQVAADATAQALPTLAPAVVETATQTVGNTTPVTDTQPTVEASASDAAAAVKTINDQLIEFYTGKVDADTIRPHFGTAPYKAVTSFAYTTLKRSLGVDVTKGDPLSVTLRYEKEPQQMSANGDNFTVSSTEYWGYTNPKTEKSLCDTRNYIYTLAKNGDVFQVTGLRSTLVSKQCDQ